MVRRCTSRAYEHCTSTRFNMISLGMGGLLFAGTYCPVRSGILDSPYGLFAQHRDDTNHTYQEVHMKASSATIYWLQPSRPLSGTNPIYLHNESNSHCLLNTGRLDYHYCSPLFASTRTQRDEEFCIMSPPSTSFCAFSSFSSFFGCVKQNQGGSRRQYLSVILDRPLQYSSWPVRLSLPLAE